MIVMCIFANLNTITRGLSHKDWSLIAIYESTADIPVDHVCHIFICYAIVLEVAWYKPLD